MALPNTFTKLMEADNFDGFLNIPESVMGKYARLKVQNSWVKKEAWAKKKGPEMEDMFIKLQLWGLMNENGKMIPFEKGGEGDEVWSLTSYLKNLPEINPFISEGDLKILFEKGVKVANKREELKAEGEMSSAQIFNEIKEYQSSLFLSNPKEGIIFQFRPRKEVYETKSGEEGESWHLTSIGMERAEVAKDRMGGLDPNKGSSIIPEEPEEPEEENSSSTPSSSSSPSKSFKREKKKGTVKAPETDLPK